MQHKSQAMPIRLMMTAAILLILIVFINIAHSSLGRYTSSFGGEVTFSPNAKGDFSLSYGEWSGDEGTGVQTLSLRVTNGEGASDDVQGSPIRIRVYVPHTDTALPALLLNQNGGEYVASVSDIPEGTAAYRNYGAGRICCFYGTDGEELSFALPASATESLDATLTLSDEDTDTTGFQLIVEPVHAENNGGDRL